MARPHLVSPLTAHLGYWLRLVANEVSAEFSEKLARRGLSVPEWVALRILYDASDAPSRIADALGMTRGAVSKLIDRLTEKGLVARNEGGRDRRYQSLILTRQGRAIVPELAALADQNDREFFSGLSEPDLHALRRILKEVVALRGMAVLPKD